MNKHKEFTEIFYAIKYKGLHVYGVDDNTLSILQCKEMKEDSNKLLNFIKETVLVVYDLKVVVEETDIPQQVLMDYVMLRKIGEHGLCGLYRFMFTVGLVIDIQKHIYKGRYCFPNMHDAEESFLSWDGTGDPSGEWIKYKGEGGERSNPNFVVS